MSDEEWEELTKFSEEENIEDEQSDFLYSSLYQGMINIGTQGCTYEMMLVVTGEYRGRIVYIDLDLQKPFFTFENNFLDWYERWLDEIIKGYDTSWFGMKMGGDDTTLIKFFQESTSEMEKVNALYGMYKLPEILPSIFEFLENECRNESEKIKKTALGVLTKSSFLRAKPFLLEFLEDDLEEIRLIALQLINWYGKDNKHEMAETVRKLLEKTNNPESFRFITYILESDENNDASIYIPFFYNANIEIRKTAIYTVGKHKDREKFLKDFINCLKSEDGWVVHTAIQALSGVTNKELLPLYAELLNKYKSEEFYIRSNVMSNLKAFGKDADYIFQ
ncbi:HEAT repeat domain-containing protein [Clostridium sp. SHJSY1]|uniref:HEAT repeat domain-containing protein n=1 Tax=Clostridium sp. SHJSY1 TaxID=2942483 RepID=UPI00287718EA|nr:HEAT repeat domain-containing protein [Clostridium sp. SHJSY1]MDS0527412.1 HEAT repeat domain-containing protein [Clostridium sp. SHJSY1]